MGEFGRVLIIAGAVAVLVGVLLLVSNRLGSGHLPGDIIVHRGNTTVYIPVATMIIVSVVITVILNLLARR